MFAVEKLQSKMQNIVYFLLTIIIYVSAKKPEKDKHTLADLSSAHRRSQAKCQLIQTSYVK